MKDIDKIVWKLALKVSFLTKEEKILYAKALKEAIIWGKTKK